MVLPSRATDEAPGDGVLSKAKLSVKIAGAMSPVDNKDKDPIHVF